MDLHQRKPFSARSGGVHLGGVSSIFKQVPEMSIFKHGSNFQKLDGCSLNAMTSVLEEIFFGRSMLKAAVAVGALAFVVCARSWGTRCCSPSFDLERRDLRNSQWSGLSG